MSEVRVYCASDLYHSMQGNAFVVRAEDYTAAQSELSALREELAKYEEGFFQKVIDEDLRKISDFVGDPDLPKNSFFMRPDAGYLANVTMHMVREVQSLRIGLTAAEQRNSELIDLLTYFRDEREYPDDYLQRLEAAIKPTESGASE